MSFIHNNFLYFEHVPSKKKKFLYILDYYYNIIIHKKIIKYYLLTGRPMTAVNV